MNWIGIKHLVLHCIEQFLHFFIPCKHHYSLPMNKQEAADLDKIREEKKGYLSWTIHCNKCDKPAKLFISIQQEMPDYLDDPVTGERVWSRHV